MYRSQVDPEYMNKLFAKYSIKECCVDLPDITLDKSLKIVNNNVKLPSKRKNRRAEGKDDDYVVPRKIKPKPTKKQCKKSPKAVSVKNTIKNYFSKVETKEVPQPSHRCGTCEVNFKSVEEIREHPPNKCRFVCGVCSRSYNMMLAFTVHVLQHKINLFKKVSVPNKLDNSSESFEENGDVKETGESNGYIKEISCELCFDIFDSEEELKEHMEFHEQLGGPGKKTGDERNSITTMEDSEDVQQGTDDDIPIPEDSKAVLECMTRKVVVELQSIPIIESTFSLAEGEESRESLVSDSTDLQPVSSGSGEPVQEAVTSPGYEIVPANVTFPKNHYKCKICERVYTSIEEYDSHVDSTCKVEKTCSVCSIAVGKNSEWYMHVTEEHQKWATCKFCFETFDEIKLLDQHKLQRHFNTFKNVCKICFKCFLTYEEFNQHLEDEH